MGKTAPKPTPTQRIKGYVVVYNVQKGRSFQVLEMMVTDRFITMLLKGPGEGLHKLKMDRNPRLLRDLSSFQKRSAEEDVFLIYLDEEVPGISWRITNLRDLEKLPKRP
ncbi:TPA: hypothetical protein EYP44_02060 [Candidatus Bathyarchaeota archaeon]|nr:hypothetical protein [Candidatus Bathyarchaeota archaeon]